MPLLLKCSYTVRLFRLFKFIPLFCKLLGTLKLFFKILYQFLTIIAFIKYCFSIFFYLFYSEHQFENKRKIILIPHKAINKNNESL